MGEYHLSPSDSENGRFSDLLPRLFGVVLKLTPLLRRTSNFFISYGVRITTYACTCPLTLSRGGGGVNLPELRGMQFFALKKAPHPRPVLNFNNYLFHALKGKYFGQKRGGGEWNKFTSSKNREDIQLQTNNKFV